MAKAGVVLDAVKTYADEGLSALRGLLGGTTDERLARAAEQGYDTSKVWYHGSNNKIDAFDTRYGDERGNNLYPEAVYMSPDRSVAAEYGDNISELYTRAQNPLVIDFKNDPKNAAHYYDMLETEEIDPAWMAKNGYDSILYDWDNGYPPEFAVLDPAAIRSVNADFNPANVNSPNLLAGLTGAAVIGSALAPEEAEAGMWDEGMRIVAKPVQTALLGATAATVAGGLAAGQAFAPDQLNPIQLGSPRPQEYIPRPSPVLSAVTKFAESQNSKQAKWAEMKSRALSFAQGAMDIMAQGDSIVRPGMPYINAALDAVDMPMQGLYGLTTVVSQLAAGSGFDQALQQGARVSQQPIDVTADEYAGPLADRGYPGTATALRTLMNVTGPI